MKTKLVVFFFPFHLYTKPQIPNTLKVIKKKKTERVRNGCVTVTSYGFVTFLWVGFVTSFFVNR